MDIFSDNLNDNIMAKAHNITAVIAFIFIIIMLFIIIHPLDFANKDIEGIYHKNEGLIWFLGLGIGAGIAMMTYINGTFQHDLKKCHIVSEQKNDVIANQNEKIIKNQLDYICKIDVLTKSINKNAEKDTEVLRTIIEQNLVIDSLVKKVEAYENKVEKALQINRKIESIEKLLKAHDKELNDLKKIVK